MNERGSSACEWTSISGSGSFPEITNPPRSCIERISGSTPIPFKTAAAARRELRTERRSSSGGRMLEFMIYPAG